MNNDKILGIILLALGVLMLLGFVGIPFIELFLGLGAIIIGVLMFMGKMRGETWMAILLIVLGAVILATPYLDFLTKAISNVIDVVVGIVLIVLGIMKIK